MAYKQNQIIYLEDTYTPTIGGTGSNPSVTYTAQAGQYYRLGDTVRVKGQITINTISGGSGNMTISIPLTSGATGGNNTGTAFSSNTTWNGTPLWYTAQIGGPSASFISFTGSRDNTTNVNTTVATLKAGDVLRWDITYSIF